MRKLIYGLIGIYIVFSAFFMVHQANEIERIDTEAEQYQGELQEYHDEFMASIEERLIILGNVLIDEGYVTPEELENATMKVEEILSEQ